MSQAFVRYLELLDQLLWRRAVMGELSDDEEEFFANALHDCRAGMTDDEPSKLGPIIAERKAVAQHVQPLDLVDVEPPMLEGPLREKAA